MIFLDANVFLRYLVTPSAGNSEHATRAAELFAALEDGSVTATTSESVLAEVAFMLTSRHGGNLSADEAATYLRELVQLPALQLPTSLRRQVVLATMLWSQRPALGFVDALTAAMSRDQQYTLATFEQDFARIADVKLLWPRS